jgi:GT2 family glycosyltransferase
MEPTGLQQGMQERRVAAIVVNYNGGEHVLECLRSLQKQTVRLEIVVVDNCSSDDSPAKIRQLFPDVRLIESPINGGWGIGCNQGIEATDSTYIALVNNDAYLDERCIEEMVRGIEADPKYGACASKILLWQDHDRIEVAGLVMYPDGTAVGRGRLQSAKLYGDVEEVFCANDCCCLYRRKMIDHIGLYDPDFFMYCDETDIGWRHQLAGWRCIYNPSAVAYHAHSAAAGDYSDFKAYHVERNRLFLVMKYFPWPAMLKAFPLSFYRYLTQWRLSRGGTGALAKYREQSSLWHGLKILMRAHFDALRKAPTMFARRRAYRKDRVMTAREQARLYDRFGMTTRQVASYE